MKKILALALTGGNECASDILVLDKPNAIRNARCARIAYCGINAGVGHADNDIGIDRVLLCQNFAGAYAAVVHQTAVNQ